MHITAAGSSVSSVREMAISIGRLKVPVPCFLVEHPNGLVLFDTGLHPDTQDDPDDDDPEELAVPVGGGLGLGGEVGGDGGSFGQRHCF